MNRGIQLLRMAAGARGLPNVTDGLVSWWKFDDGSGSTAVDSAGSNDGTLVGPPDWVTGKIGGALDFDGVGDRVSVGTMGDYGSTKLTTGTISMWIKTTDTSSITALTGVFNTGINTALAIYSIIDGNHLGFYLRANGGNELYKKATSDPEVRDGAWHHVAWSWDGPSNAVSIYVNGEGVSVSSITTNSPNSFSNFGFSLVFGARNLRGTMQFHTNTAMDDVRIYDRILSAAEIATVYNWRP